MSAQRAQHESLWRRALVDRAWEDFRGRNVGAKGRLVLFDLLDRAGHFVSIVTIHTWSRQQQGEAYLWAHAFLLGREDIAAPQHVIEGARR